MQKAETLAAVIARGLYATVPVKLDHLWEHCQTVLSVAGSVVEVGTARGCSTFVIGNALPGRTIHVYDTFTGIPDSKRVEGELRAGCFGDIDLSEVQRFLSPFDMRYHVGVFPDTWIDPGQIAFAYIDPDIQQTALDALNLVWPKLANKGLVIVDDCGNPEAPFMNQLVYTFGSSNKANFIFHDECRHALLFK